MVSASQKNLETIKTAYAAFQRGDIAAVLDLVADDVDWASEASGTGAPWFGPHKGKQGAGEFFDALGKTMEIEDFTPITYATTDDGDVLAVVRYAARSRETGKVAKMNLHHWWRFTNGKISFYRGTEDTALTVGALAQ